MITKRNFRSLCILSFEIFFIIELVMMPTRETTVSAMQEIGSMALCCFILSSIAMYQIEGRTNAFFYFICFTYIFSFGQSFMSLINEQIENSVFSVAMGFFSNEVLKKSAVFVLLAILVTCIGYCFIYKKPIIGNDIIIAKSDLNHKVNRLRILGWVLFFISFIPTIYLLIQDIQTLMTVGYGATLKATTGVNRIFTLISGFFTSSIMLLYLFEIKHRKIVYMIVLAYLVLQVVGGSRIEVFRFAILILLIEQFYFNSLNKRKWILILIFGLAAALVLSLVSSVRNYIYLTSDVRNLIKSSIKKLLDNNFIVACINEMGNTQLINTLVLDRCPSVEPFQLGLSYIKILWAILPNFIGSAYTGYIGVDITFSPYYTVTDAGMGASYISEGYWNFGYFSFIWFFLFGMFFAYVVRKFEHYSARKTSPDKLFLMLYIINFMMFLVRSESLEFGRSLAYYAIIPLLLSKCHFGLRLWSNNSKYVK